MQIQFKRLLLPFLFVHVGASADTEIGQVANGTLFMGKRSFALPPGDWLVVNSRVTNTGVTGGTVSSNGGEVKTQYLVQLDGDKKLKAAVTLISTLTSTAGIGRWNDSTCDRKDVLYISELDGNFDKPACFRIFHETNFYRTGVPSNDFGKAIWQWFREKDIQLPWTVVRAEYVKYFAGDFVRAIYWFNPDVAGVSPDNEITWNKNTWHKDLISSKPQQLQYADEVKKWGSSMVAAYRLSLMDGNSGISALPQLPSVVKSK